MKGAGRGWRPAVTRQVDRLAAPHRAAESASDVRIHARKVRSFARLKLASGSLPTP